MYKYSNISTDKTYTLLFKAWKTEIQNTVSASVLSKHKLLSVNKFLKVQRYIRKLYCPYKFSNDNRNICNVTGFAYN